MKLVKYTTNSDDWVVLTDKEMQMATEQWAAGAAFVRVERIQKILPPPKFHPCGSLPGFDQEDFYWSIGRSNVLAFNKATGNLCHVQFYPNEAGYYYLERTNFANYKYPTPERFKELLAQGGTYVSVDDKLSELYPGIIKMPGQRVT